MKLTAAMMIAVAGACGTALADPTLFPGKPMPVTSMRQLGAEHVRGGNAVVVGGSSRYQQTVLENTTTTSGVFYLGGGTPGVGFNYRFGAPFELDGSGNAVLTTHRFFFSGAGGGTADDIDFVVVYYSACNDYFANWPGSRMGVGTAYILYGTFTGIDLSAGIGYYIDFDLAATFGGGATLPGSQGVYMETFFCDPGTAGVGTSSDPNYNADLDFNATEITGGQASITMVTLEHASSHGAPTVDGLTYGTGWGSDLFANDDGDFSTSIQDSDMQYYFGNTTLFSFAATFEASSVHCPSDFNHDGFPDIYDFTDFVTAFETGC